SCAAAGPLRAARSSRLPCAPSARRGCGPRRPPSRSPGTRGGGDRPGGLGRRPRCRRRRRDRPWAGSLPCALDEPADVALAQRGRGEAPLPQLPGQALEDGLVPEILRLELAVAANDELVDRLGEVGEQLVDQPGELRGAERADPSQVAEQVAQS